MKFIEQDERLYEMLAGEPIEIAAYLLGVTADKIERFQVQSQGMTNHSYRFYCDGNGYILRLPGAGTSELINREQEGHVYLEIANLGISEKVVAFDCNTGIKLSVFMEDCRTLDPDNWDDVSLSLDVLHYLHNSGKRVEHSFELRERLSYYSRLCINGGAALPENYIEDINLAYSLLDGIDAMGVERTICHIDTVPANFIIQKSSIMRLIDWEYSAMGDPITDVAMLALRCEYDYDMSIKALDYYLGRRSDDSEKQRLFTLMASAGLLWTLWSAYKMLDGEDYTEYSDKMYRLFKIYAAYARQQFSADLTSVAGM